MLTIGSYYDVFARKGKLFAEEFFGVLELMTVLMGDGHQQSFLCHRVDDPYSCPIIAE